MHNSKVDSDGGRVGSTSSTLIHLAVAHDPGAWERLVHLYGPMVYDWARLAGLQTEDAGDVVQEVFSNLVKALSQFQSDRDDANFRGWLRTITRNKVLDALRYQADRPQATGGSDALERLLQVPDAVSDLSSMHGRNSSNARLAHALETIRSEFEERTWQAFWSVVVEGRHSTDVATNLGISANAVYIARSRVVRRLRELLSNEA